MTPATKKNLLFVSALILFSINLRASIVAFGPLVSFIQDATGCDKTTIGFIGTLPLLAFAAISPFASRIAQRYGLENTLIWGAIGIAVGCALRSAFVNVFSIMAGTFVLSAGIALGNVLLSAAIRRDEPKRIEDMSGLQMFTFGAVAGIAAAIAVPIADIVGWQWSLGLWGFFAIPPIFVWLAIKRANAGSELPETVPPSFNIWKSPLAWFISAFCGIQSLVFYALVNWLPSMITARGYTLEEAGYCSTIFQLIALPTVLVITPLSERVSKMNYLMVGAACVVISGLFMLWHAPASLMWLSTAIVGIGCCSTYTLCLMLFSLRGTNSAEAAALSGMAQTVGYLIASLGPVVTGKLFDLTGGWEIPVYALVGCGVLEILFGWFAGQDRSLQ